MNLIKLLIICVLFINTSCSSTDSKPMISKEPAYDSILAVKLKADEYGMRKYVFAILKKGPNRDQDSSTKEQLQKAHMDNINRLAEEGKLSLAGPFLDDGDMRGIYVFNVETIEQAKELVESDPAVKAGRLIFDMHLWYGSAALMEVNDIHNKIQRTSH